MLVRLTVRGLLTAVVVPVLGVVSWASAELPRSAPAMAVPSPPAVEPRPSVMTGKAGETRRRQRPRWLLWGVFGSSPSVDADAGGYDGDFCTYSGSVARHAAPTVRIERLEPLALCLEGFKQGDRPLLEFTGDSGMVWPGRKGPDGPGSRTWSWNALQMAALFPHPGAYPFVVTVTGVAVATGRVIVRPAATPDAMFSYQGRAADDFTAQNRLRPGETLTITAVGYRPGSPIFASLYGGQRNNRVRLLSDLPPVTADQYGEGVLRWTATSDDKPGSRAILVEPVSAGTSSCEPGMPRCDRFRMGR
jgi:hypothetical protein